MAEQQPTTVRLSTEWKLSPAEVRKMADNLGRFAVQGGAATHYDLQCLWVAVSLMDKAADEHEAKHGH